MNILNLLLFITIVASSISDYPINLYLYLKAFDQKITQVTDQNNLQYNINYGAVKLKDFNDLTRTDIENLLRLPLKTSKIQPAQMAEFNKKIRNLSNAIYNNKNGFMAEYNMKNSIHIIESELSDFIDYFNNKPYYTAYNKNPNNIPKVGQYLLNVNLMSFDYFTNIIKNNVIKGYTEIVNSLASKVLSSEQFLEITIMLKNVRIKALPYYIYHNIGIINTNKMGSKKNGDIEYMKEKNDLIDEINRLTNLNLKKIEANYKTNNILPSGTRITINSIKKFLYNDVHNKLSDLINIIDKMSKSFNTRLLAIPEIHFKIMPTFDRYIADQKEIVFNEALYNICTDVFY